MFNDAVELYQYTTNNPVLKKLKPSASQAEARHLNLTQIVQLLRHVDGKKYGLAIWIQLYLGLRAGELMALRWGDLDLETGRITIRRTFVRKTGMFRDYPKGKKQHTHSVPGELLQKFRETIGAAKSDLVVHSPASSRLPLAYRWYLVALKKYCEELGIPMIASHGLRHSTSELYIHNGASKDDLQRLFAHATPSITARYVHNWGTNLERVANNIRVLS